MINDVGKTSVIIRLNDYVINMVNSTLGNSVTGSIRIFDEDGSTLRYTMTVGDLQSRCLMYARLFSGDSIDTSLRPVVYIPSNVSDVGTGGVSCIPLYECISPSVSKLINGNYQVTWWSNTDSALAMDETSKYVYDYSKIHKFKSNALDDVDSTSSACKILCTAPVHWEKLKMDGYDDMTYMTPIIRDIAVLACISGEGYIVDFSTGGGGSGGGMRVHSHLNTQDCGFAGAVFMPSATPRVMSWK